MVRGAAAEAAADYARDRASFSVGLHLDLAECRYENGEWIVSYEVVDTRDAAAVQRECERQLRKFESLMRRRPTHLDSHQHVHRSEPARSIVSQIAAELNVQLRDCSPVVSYYGGFYGQTSEGDPYPDGVSVTALVSAIENLPAGWTELGCHPGYVDDLDSVYRLEREAEVRALCSDAARAALRRCGAQLRSFAEVPIVDAPPRGTEGAPRFRG
jgi:predicted glycoside hydrolase/deacetylase ChbG (UPF0249 family)